MSYPCRGVSIASVSLVLTGALSLTACVYSPLRLTNPLTDGGDTISGGGDGRPGDAATPADPGGTPSCGPLIISSGVTMWAFGSNLIVPRPSAPGAILFTANAASCTTKWVVGGSETCTTNRPTACYSPGAAIFEAQWTPTPAAGAVVTVPFAIEIKDSSGATVNVSKTLTFLPTLAERSRFVGLDSSATGDGQTPMQAASLVVAMNAYSDAGSESFGLYLKHGSVSAPGGLDTKPGTLLVGSFDDQWGYDPCPSRCSGAADLTWQSTGPSWIVDPLACQTWAHATVWDATTSGGSGSLLSFSLEPDKVAAASGFAGMTFVASGADVSPVTLVDVKVKDTGIPGLFVARDSLLASIYNPAIPLRIGQTPTVSPLTIELGRVTVVGRGSTGPANGIIIYTHLRPAAEIVQTCVDLQDLDSGGGGSSGDAIALLWQSLEDSTAAPPTETLSLYYSALVANVPARNQAVGVRVFAPWGAAEPRGRLKVNDSAVTTVGSVSSMAIDAIDLTALDVTGTIAHAQASAGSGVAGAIQASSLHPLTPMPMHTPMRFDFDVLCTHLGGGGSGTTYGIRLFVDSSATAGPDVYVRNTRIDPITVCGGPTNANGGNAVGVNVAGVTSTGTLAVGGSVICAGEQTAGSHRGIVANSIAVHIYDSMVGGGPCNGEGTNGSESYGVEVGAVPSLLIERSWIDSGLRSDSSYSQTDAAIKLWDGGQLTLTSNVLVASSTLVARGTAWDYAGTDIGYNTVHLPDRTASVGSIQTSWGIEGEVTAAGGTIHDNLVALPAYAPTNAVSSSTLGGALANNTYLILDSGNSIINTPTNYIVVDPPLSSTSVFCTPRPRASFDAHLSTAAVNAGPQGIRYIGGTMGNVYPIDIDRQARSALSTDPNNYRGADAEANDGCPAGRPLAPVSVDTSSP